MARSPFDLHALTGRVRSRDEIRAGHRWDDIRAARHRDNIRSGHRRDDDSAGDRPVTAVLAVGLAFALDAALAEFPRRVHPVALFGRVVDAADREWRRPRAVGLALAVALPAGAAATVGGTVVLADALDALVGSAVAGLALFATTSLRMLLSAAREVVDTSGTDLAAARETAPALVGRDPGALSPGQLRSAALESAAENLADGLVAPLFAFVVGAQVSVAWAAGAAAWVKAVNTLDSMLGYRSNPLGWAPARLDDAVMWLPARASAVLLAVAAGDPRALTRAMAWRTTPPSPNSGWPMAALSAALDVRLEKPGAYVLNAEADLPTPGEARRGLRVVGVAGLLSFAIAGVGAWL